jgi:hypothetical protein
MLVSPLLGAERAWVGNVPFSLGSKAKNIARRMATGFRSATSHQMRSISRRKALRTTGIADASHCQDEIRASSPQCSRSIESGVSSLTSCLEPPLMDRAIGLLSALIASYLIEDALRSTTRGLRGRHEMRNTLFESVLARRTGPGFQCLGVPGTERYSVSGWNKHGPAHLPPSASQETEGVQMSP